MSNPFRIVKLQCGAQSYDWGKLGQSSAVAQFAEAANPNFKISDDKPYAELWMGTHPSVPSMAVTSSDSEPVSLRTVLSSHPDLLGSRIADKFGAGELPFLFKVLSIRKALSIQAHPDKALAKQLHANDPSHYPDDNHKPEMAIAITEFEGFCGFRPLAEIAALLKNVPEFVGIIGGQQYADDFINSLQPLTTSDEEGSPNDVANRKALQSLFSRVMNASDSLVEKYSKLLIERAQKEGSNFGYGESKDTAQGSFGKPLADLLVCVNEQFPNDIGLFCGGLMLNYVTLKPGQAMFLRAKDPHAYISGDIIECMAASDNVVRAGFTPKFKDVSNLVSMLTYSYDPVEKQKMVPEPFKLSSTSSSSAKNTLYNPPIDEFAVVQTTLAKNGDSTKFEALDGPAILLITNGNAEIKDKDTKLTLKRGEVVFVGAGTATEFTSTSDEEVVAYTAIVEVTPA